MLLIDEEFLPQATALIDTAQRRIDISTFKAEITSKPRGRRLHVFFDKLFQKRYAGVQINFLLNWHTERRVMPLTNLAVARVLKNHKINVRILPDNRCCHAKIILVDQNKAIVGSHNLSIKSCHNNFEMSYLVLDPDSIGRLCNYFCHVFINAGIPL